MLPLRLARAAGHTGLADSEELRTGSGSGAPPDGGQSSRGGAASCGPSHIRDKSGRVLHLRPMHLTTLALSCSIPGKISRRCQTPC